jgi:hypothetical protein
MMRFQTAYKNHLVKQKEKLELKEREVVGFMLITDFIPENFRRFHVKVSLEK